MYIYICTYIEPLLFRDYFEKISTRVWVDRRRLVDLIKDFILYRETH